MFWTCDTSCLCLANMAYITSLISGFVRVNESKMLGHTFLGQNWGSFRSPRPFTHPGSPISVRHGTAKLVRPWLPQAVQMCRAHPCNTWAKWGLELGKQLGSRASTLWFQGFDRCSSWYENESRGCTVIFEYIPDRNFEATMKSQPSSWKG